jgi:hypothetical protein
MKLEFVTEVLRKHLVWVVGYHAENGLLGIRVPRPNPPRSE